MGKYVHLHIHIIFKYMHLLENVNLGCGCGCPKKRHLAQFPVTIEAAAAKLQTRKAHSHAALIGGSSRVL